MHVCIVVCTCSKTSQGLGRQISVEGTRTLDRFFIGPCYEAKLIARSALAYMYMHIYIYTTCATGGNNADVPVIVRAALHLKTASEPILGIDTFTGDQFYIHFLISGAWHTDYYGKPVDTAKLTKLLVFRDRIILLV